MSSALFSKGTEVIDFLHKFCETIDLAKHHSWNFRCIRDNERNLVYVLCKFQPNSSNSSVFTCLHKIKAETDIDKMTALFTSIISTTLLNIYCR